MNEVNHGGMMKNRTVLTLSAIVLGAFILSSPAQAGTVTILEDSSAAQGNFQSPGSTANVGYTIETSDDGTNFDVVLNSRDPNALSFANLYFDTIASTPGTGSNLGFEFGPSSEDAFDPSTSTKYSLTGSGVTSAFTKDSNGTTADIVIPNSFFLNNPEGMPFAPTPDGSLVSLHLSQSFSYSVVGGSANFAAPVELGDEVVSASTPEPGSMGLFGFGIFLCAGVARKLRRV
jgi:PEP-CTERM motif-containing protein